MKCARAVSLTLSGPASYVALAESRRNITRLYTSYYQGQLFPNQLAAARPRLPPGVKASHARQGANDSPLSTITKHPAEAPEGVTWEDAESTDVIQSNLQTSASPPATTRAARPFVPLGEVARIELQGDYLTEGNLHQEALEHYGVVAKAYQLAYPEHHSQRIGIMLKLAGAFRRTGRLESSAAVLKGALASLDASNGPSLELIVESLLELGLTLEAQGSEEAGAVLEEAVTVVNAYHNFGDSHRMLRLLPRLGRRFNLNYEEKFLYYSPFDYDRTFALVDQCLDRAESFYETRKDSEGLIRALTLRKELVDKKFFNMRDFAGRIHTQRGHWMRRAGILTNAPTPDEVLRYSPTIHQVHRDFKYELNAPIGREKEVQQGVNRVVKDMGNPYRRSGHNSRRLLRDADCNFAKYVRNNEFKV